MKLHENEITLVQSFMLDFDISWLLNKQMKKQKNSDNQFIHNNALIQTPNYNSRISEYSAELSASVINHLHDYRIKATTLTLKYLA